MTIGWFVCIDFPDGNWGQIVEQQGPRGVGIRFGPGQGISDGVWWTLTFDGITRISEPGNCDAVLATW